MADLTVKIPHPNAQKQRGEEFYQKTGNSADASSGVAIVSAVAGKVAVIDNLIVSAAATEDISLKAGTDFLMQIGKTTAEQLSLDVLPGDKQIRSDTVNEAITLVVTAGQMYYTVWYHYETVGTV